MSDHFDRFSELDALLGDLRDDFLDDEKLRRLDAILADDPEAVQYYVEFIDLFSALTREPAAWRNEERGTKNEEQGTRNWQRGLGTSVPSAFGSVPATINDQCSIFNDQSFAPSVPHSSFIILHSPSLPSFFGGVLFSYLTAAVILGTALAIAWAWKLPDYTQIAVQSAPSFSPLAPRPSSGMQFVGRVTGMVDCQWSDPHTATIDRAHVPLGRKYAISSGLMEITYDTGAKVILQGPVTYEVESAASGFLSVGKLTARLEREVESGEWKVRSSKRPIINQKSEIINPHSPLSTLHSPLFTIKTPTATVTDLGTEFGVEVSKEGNTMSHVFRGVVEVRPTNDGGKQAGRTIRLTENESVEVNRQASDGTITVNRIAADPAAFVRAEQIPKLAEEQRLRPLRRWQAYSERLCNDPALLAYYTFEHHGGDVRALSNKSALGGVLDGQVEGAEWVLGRLPGKYALYFHGPGSGDKVVLPEQERFKFTSGPFSVAVWFKIERFTAEWQGLVTKGDESWRLAQAEKTNNLVFDTDSDEPGSLPQWHLLNSKTEVADGRWHLATIVYEPAGNVAHKRMYIDARLDAEQETPLPLRQNDKSVWLGNNCDGTDREFWGMIDEVAIFSRALTADELTTMFEAGSPVSAARAR